MESLSFRQQVVGRFVSVFGEPQTIPTIDGPLYRWVIPARDGSTLRLTIDSPEFPGLAHVLISDARNMSNPVGTNTIRTLAEVDVIRRSDTPAGCRLVRRHLVAHADRTASRRRFLHFPH
jgi:hypothetical protein